MDLLGRRTDLNPVAKSEFLWAAADLTLIIEMGAVLSVVAVGPRCCSTSGPRYSDTRCKW
jgi:hypothetical protein